MIEAGYKDFVFDTYTALMAPVKTPPEIVRTLEKNALEILNRPDMRAKLTQSGFEVTAKDGKGHMARVAKEVPMFRDIITQAGIKKLYTSPPRSEGPHGRLEDASGLRPESCSPCAPRSRARTCA